MSDVLLDTNIVSFLMRGEARTTRVAREARDGDSELILSAMVEYEIRRGLLKRNARAGSRAFEAIRKGLSYRPFDERTWELGAELWAHSRKLGSPIPDADLLIAAQAI